MSTQELLGGAGAITVSVGAIFYVREIFRGNARPHTGSWLVWAVIGVLGFAASVDAGAGPGAWAAGVFAVASTITVLFSLNPRYGKPGVEWYDWPLCGLAVAAIIAWQAGVLPGTAAVTLCVGADSLGLVPTLRESWREPSGESRVAWTIDAAGTALCLLAVADLSYTSLVYPAYLWAANATMAAVLWMRRGVTPGAPA